MTMATRAHIAKPCDAEALFLHLLRLLEADPSFVPAWERNDPDAFFNPEPGPLRLGRATYQHENNEFRTTVGQGLAAILEVEYAIDGPLVWPPTEWDDGDDEQENFGPFREHLVSVDFDTAYSYKNGHGGGCDDLHAFLLNEIREWLAERDISEWAWRHEELGTWHGPDEIALRGDASNGRP